MRKVTSAEIERLYTFTQQHYVEYYDVQTELVDHLANAIEKHWEEKPGANFEEVLQQEFKKFGVFGFMEVVEQRQLAMQKRYYKLLWTEVKKFLQMPKVFLTLAVIWIIVKMVMSFKGIDVWFAGFLLCFYLCCGVFSLIKTYQFRKKSKKANRPRYLLEEILCRNGNFGAFVIIPQMLFHYPFDNSFNYAQHFWASVFFASIFVGLGLYFLVTLYILPKQKEKILQKVYPELRFN